MSKTILTKVDGFTPLPDLLVKRYNIVVATVWGSAWRYCQMSDGVCRASMDKIGTRAGVSRQTAQKHMNTLVDDGFFEDTTPTLKNRPHIYRDTGKVAMYNRLGIGVNEIDSSVNEIDSQCKEGLHEDSSKTEIKNKYNHKKGKEEAKERIAKQRASKKDPLDFLVENGKDIQMLKDMRLRVEAATGLGLSREWDKARSPWNGYEKTLIKREAETGQTIEQFMEWYNSDKFRKDNNSIWLNPDKIELWWGKAFKSRRSEELPEQPWKNEEWRNVELG